MKIIRHFLYLVLLPLSSLRQQFPLCPIDWRKHRFHLLTRFLGFQLLVFLWLTVSSTKSYAQEYWVPFYTQSDNGDVFYFDNRGIGIENFGSGTRIVNVNVMVNKFEPYINQNGRAVNSMRTVYSYNCFNRRIRFSDVSMFSGKDGKGTRVAIHPSKNEWREVKKSRHLCLTLDIRVVWA
jgi:hypothetical protein